MAQGHKAILWAVSFLICFPQSQLFPTPYSSLWNKPQFQRQELPLPIPKFKPLQRGASCSFLQFFFSQQQNYPSLVKVWHKPFHLCSPKWAMPQNISNLSPVSMLHGKITTPSFPALAAAIHPSRWGYPTWAPAHQARPQTRDKHNYLSFPSRKTSLTFSRTKKFHLCQLQSKNLPHGEDKY